MHKLETLLSDIDFGSLPPVWTTFNLVDFSREKKLWDYQQEALRNGIKTLYRYFSYPGSVSTTDRKRLFATWYSNNDILPGPVAVDKLAHSRLLSPYFPIADGRLSFEHLINRMGFWMATGSGKTLVIVKLIEVLQVLMREDVIPRNDVLLLTHREDLMAQLFHHVREFNAAGLGLTIRLRDLRQYAEVKRTYPSLLNQDEITVFIYRSDNLNDTQKERIVDFRNYDNGGRWYVLLDEAHKGDKDDSKRQHIYSILSREGFLFNFSATFTDNRDKLTTAAEFNLASFVASGYGKHIAIMRQENRAFRRDEDYSDEEKQRIVLQSLLMLAYVTRIRERLGAAVDMNLYHRPMLVALVNSVNTTDADLKLFFTQLDRIARGEIGRELFQQAKRDLLEELKAEPVWLYERERFRAVDLASSYIPLTMRDVLRLVFNTDSHGAIEVIARPSNRQELAFKLKSTDAPFALVRIGNTAEWLREFLNGYEIVTGFDDESYFERINQDDSSINLLLGSRTFYEGWDSNRPNVITFINIGVGAAAKKFILQSVGRGVRVEPQHGKRRRLQNLAIAGFVPETTYKLAKEFLPPIESLFIFGTNRNALESVMDELEEAGEPVEGIQLSLEINEAAQGRLLLVPTYRNADRLLSDGESSSKFPMSPEDLALLRDYTNYLDDDRLLVAHNRLEPRQIGMLHKALKKPEQYVIQTKERNHGRLSILLPRFIQYLALFPRELETFKLLDEEIDHFRQFRVILEDIEDLRRKIDSVKSPEDIERRKGVLKERFNRGEIGLDDYTAGIELIARTSTEETYTPPSLPLLSIKHLATHYYVPLLVSDDERLDYINYVVKVRSEVSFIRQLENYLRSPSNIFHHFDWWMFSRMVEQVDRVTIPYYDPGPNRIRDFYPDFIFWLKHGGNGSGIPNYFIQFVDPKGTENTGYQFKIDGYERLFTNPKTGMPRVFHLKGMNVRVLLSMHSKDANLAPQKYRKYWVDHPEQFLAQALQLADIAP